MSHQDNNGGSPGKPKTSFSDPAIMITLFWHLIHCNLNTALTNLCIPKVSCKPADITSCFFLGKSFLFFFFWSWNALEKLPWKIQNNYSQYPNRYFSLPMYLSPLVFFGKTQKQNKPTKKLLISSASIAWQPSFSVPSLKSYSTSSKLHVLDKRTYWVLLVNETISF